MDFLAGLIVILIIGIFFAGFIFICIKVNNLKYRAKQHILKGTGISSSDISSGVTGALEKKQMQKFLAEHQEFTEESIKDLLRQYTVHIFNRNSIDEFSPTVCEKIQKDSKINKMQTMEYKRANINHYGNARLSAVVVYTDNRDEYNVYLNCNIVNDKIQVERYQIAKGDVVGF